MSTPAHSMVTRSRNETVQIGRKVAELLQPGDVVVLTGELGAGKTALTSGLIDRLGSDEPVTSPTFTIMRHHELPQGGQVLHLDAYRLSGPDDAEDIGLLELLDNGAIAVVEWGEVLAEALGPDLLVIEMAHGEAEDDRIIRIEPRGARWAGTDLERIAR